MRVMVYDASDKSTVARFWRIGAWIFKSHFDEVRGIRSVQELRALLESFDAIDEIQIWGHGSAGKPVINGEKIPNGWWEWQRCRLIWFRSCSVMYGDAGAAYAAELATHRQVSVAGHTRRIGNWGMHSGLVALRPNEAPWWDLEDGGTSSPWAPRTIAATTMALPRWAWREP